MFTSTRGIMRAGLPCRSYIDRGCWAELPAGHFGIELDAGQEGATELAVKRVRLLWRGCETMLHHHTAEVRHLRSHRRKDKARELPEASASVNTADGILAGTDLARHCPLGAKVI